MTAKLKPCPFCGAEAALAWQDGFPQVRCGGCGAATGLFVTGHGPDAVKAWETRVAPTAPTNDAPVTVEDRVAAWPLRSECYKAADKDTWMAGTYDAHRAIQAMAAHRLAALASAPAGDEVRIERAVMDDVIREIYRREGWTRGDKGGFPTVAARCNSLYTITAEPRRNRYVAVRAAALARPRAAVGERIEVVHDIDVPTGAWDWIGDIGRALDGPHVRLEQPRDHETIVLWHDEQPVAFVLNLRDQFNRSIQYRVALQSPPAKVEP